jgi:hypothetical protein
MTIDAANLTLSRRRPPSMFHHRGYSHEHEKEQSEKYQTKHEGSRRTLCANSVPHAPQVLRVLSNCWQGVFFAAPPTAGRTLREPQDCSTPRAPRLSRENAPWLSRENVPLRPPGQLPCRDGTFWLALETRL